jgi:hypothetical protein
MEKQHGKRFTQNNDAQLVLVDFVAQHRRTESESERERERETGEENS